jgi:putative thioredoxin
METLVGQANPPATADADLIKDVTDRSFLQDVIEASQQVPVLVDFWAPWCGPCKQLGPLLEKVVREARGALRLAKVNVDVERGVAGQLGIQSIPAVFAFKNGQPVDGFVGALPESQIKAFIQRLMGPGAEPMGYEEAIEAARLALEKDGDVEGATEDFLAILAEDPANPAALAGLARCYIAANAPDKARATLDKVPANARNHPDVEGAQAALALLEQSAGAGEVAGLRAAVEQAPDDLQARYDLALALFAAGDRQGAIDHLLDLVRRDREWNEQAARKQLVQVFEALGPTDPLTVSSRRRLSSLLFS